MLHFSPTADRDPFDDLPSCVLFVGINGAGKTTTVGKLAGKAKTDGIKVLIGGADTFRAAAIEQLEVWGKRADVEVITRQRGSDPASVCYDVVDYAEKTSSSLVLIDTAGRLHTSEDLMRELAKVVNVTRKRSGMPTSVVLVIDATTGQNGLSQAKEFNDALDIDGLIVTKLDGTAKGGIALAIAHQLKLPIFVLGWARASRICRPLIRSSSAKPLLAALKGCKPQVHGHSRVLLARQPKVRTSSQPLKGCKYV